MNKKVLLWFAALIGLFLILALPVFGAPDPRGIVFSEQVSIANRLSDIPSESGTPPGDTESYYFLTVRIEERSSQGNYIRYSVERGGEEIQRGQYIYDFFRDYYREGTVVELDAYTRYTSGGTQSVFVHWSGDIGDNDETNPHIRITMDSEKSITAHFDDTYLLDLKVIPEKGGYVLPRGNEFYFRGNELTLTAFPAPGYRFHEWSPEAKTNPVKIKMDSPKYISAYFVRVETGEVELDTGPHPWAWDLGMGRGPLTFGAFREDGVLERLLPWVQPSNELPPVSEAEEAEEDLDVDDEMTEADIGRPTVMTADIKPVVEIIDDKSGCRGLLRVNYEVTHLPEIPYLIDYVRLTIDGQEYGIWTGIPAEHYQHSTLKEVLCTGSHSIRLEATSTVPEERGIKQITVTEDVELPPVSAQFTWDLQDIPGEDCRKWLVVTFEAHDLSGPDKGLDIVSLRANTAYWYWKEGWNQEHHPRYTVRKEVFCGQIYLLELVATDVDGNKYTYLREVTIPTPQPPDEPAEPDEPDEPPAPPPPQQTLYAAFMAQVQSIVTQQGCSSTLTVSFDGKDLTGGQYSITSVKLKVTGPGFTQTYDSKPVQNPNHHDTKSWSGLACGHTFNIEVTVTNSIGQTVTSTGSITTPIP
jgi:hypothetical protein